MPAQVNEAEARVVLSQAMLRRVRAEQCRRNFYRFVQTFWHTVIPEKPVWNWHIPFLCNELQVIAERVFRREPKEYDLVINVPPGTTKSTIVSVMFPAWCWTRDPTVRTLSASYSHPLSLDLATRSRDIVLSARYQMYFNGVWIREDVRGKGHYKTTKTGERLATSIGGTLTGFHGHFLLIDDPLNPKEAVSEVALKGANDWLDNTLPSRKIDKRITPTILIMQRLHTNDCTAHVLEKAKELGARIRHICLPAEVSELVHPPELKDRYVHGLLDEVRMDEEVLREQKVALGSYGYAGQFDQSPTPLEGGLFKVHEFQQVPLIDWRQVARALRYWDKGATEGGGAYTAGVLLLEMKAGYGGPRWIVADVVRGQWSALKREQMIRSTAESDGRTVEIWVEQEPGGGGKSDAEATIRNLAGFNAHKETATTAKDLRAIPYAAQVEAGQVGLPFGAPWVAEYVRELQYFPNHSYMDQVDASSGAFNRLTQGARVGTF